MFFFYLWTAFYTPSWNGTPWVLNSEMFDQNVRTLAQAFAAANNWFWNFIVARFTPQMFTAMGFGVYFLFASLMLCSAVFVWFLIPETKGIPRSYSLIQTCLEFSYGVAIVFLVFPGLKKTPYFKPALIENWKLTSDAVESMDRLFQLPIRKAHRIVLDELRVMEEEFRHNAEGSGVSTEKENVQMVEKV